MPYTLSHPLAVVPLRQSIPFLSLPALVIGSMSPDFGYFIERFDTANYCHTLPGTLTHCLPAGLAILGIFYLLRGPVCFLLPQPHRAALTPLATEPLQFSVRGLLVAALSILLGAWTHTVWDSFTHPGEWFVKRIAILREPIFRIGDFAPPLCSVLQHVSTVVGAAGLALCYYLWLRHQPAPRPAEDEIDTMGRSSDAWRYGVLVSLGLVAFIVAAAAAYHRASAYQGVHAFAEFAFWGAVYFPDAVIVLLVPTALMTSTIQHKSRSTSRLR